MDQKATEIINRAMRVFMRYGIKSVNMDDISRQLGISKKTLYKYVSDKTDLVKKAFRFHCDAEDKQLKEISDKNLNAIDESFEVMRMVMNMISDLHPSVLYDLQKYHPELMSEMEKERHRIMYKSIKENLERGLKEGLYREDIKPDIVASFYVSSVESIFHKLSFVDTEYTFKELYTELFRMHIRGIASDKGIQYLVEKMKTEQHAN